MPLLVKSMKPFSTNTRGKSPAVRATPLVLLCLIAESAHAVEAAHEVELVEVVGLAPVEGKLNTRELPFAVQVFGKDDMQRSHYYSLVNLLGERGTSVTTNSAQNNRLQPDLQFRGFTASPLLGAPQGVAVFQNGIRVNEVFGDTVNWDLLPTSFIDSIHVVAGANPVYGLNALGGAIRIETRTGFSDDSSRMGLTFASAGVHDLQLSTGGNRGDWGYFLAGNAMKEDGWRDYSNSSAYNIYSALSWRGDSSALDIFYNWADTELRGNGTSPEMLLKVDRSAVFTHPDMTENDLGLISFSYRQWWGENSQLSINGFHRSNDTTSFNGDGSEFDECDAPSGAGYLCREEDNVPVEDQSGRAVSDEWNAVNNRSRRDQRSAGLTVQWFQAVKWGGLRHQWVVGTDYFEGTSQFESNVEFAALTEDRGTQGSGLFDSQGDTLLQSRTRTASFYLSDRIELTDRLSLTFSSRYNDTRIRSEDPSGEKLELFGDHSYKRLNGGAGAIYQFTDDVLLYTNLQQTSRTPSPVELACSHEDAPCTLPNTFLADPPLDDVVARGGEIGLRGLSDGWIKSWRVGLFHTRNDNDIIFQTTGGVSSNQGYFTNAADTVRQGLELEVAGLVDSLSWHASYSYLHASFDDAFTSSTPHHPQAEDGSLPVTSGSRIPGLPDHNFKLGLSWDVSARLVLGLDLQLYSGQYLRGDEANRDRRTPGYGITNLQSSWFPGENLEVQLRVTNVFDREYESFGQYGEADEVLADIENDSNRFLGPGSPRQYWLTFNYHW